MLADSRSQALVDNFVGQWLYLRNVPALTPDLYTYPDFNEGLRRAMKRETELFFEHILREDRSVLDLLTADYTFLNESLARALRRSERVRGHVQARHAPGGQRARRAAGAGEHPRGDVAGESDVSRRSGQVDSREHPRLAATGASCGRASAPGGDRRWSRGDDDAASASPNIARIRCVRVVTP